MDETTDTEPTVPTPVAKLHRSATKKVFGGVAGGISERFDVDANVVRVVFVVLGFVWGLGVAIYLTMWALIPRSPLVGDVATHEEELDPARTRWLRYAIPLGVLVIFLIALATFNGVHHFGRGYNVAGWRFDRGLVLFWFLFLIVLAVIALRAAPQRLTFGRFIALGFLSFLSVIILAVGAFLITVQVIGVPVEGGSGVKLWSPTSIAQIQRSYHGAFGESEVNLRHVPFASGTWNITMTQGVGVLIVDLPPNVVVNLRTHVGIGTVETQVFRPLNPSATSSATRSAPANLSLNLQVGMGQIQIHRFTR